MSHSPYFGVDPRRVKRQKFNLDAGWFYHTVFNEMLLSTPEKSIYNTMEEWEEYLAFSKERLWFCLTGLSKKFYFGVYGCEAEKYLEIFDRYRMQVETTAEHSGYETKVFMVFQDDIKQMAVLLFPGKAPKCSPQELARQINDLGQKIYERSFFKGDTRYCNVTSLSDELHGYTGIREGYLQTRKLNDLAFFHMEPAVITTEWVEKHRNGADYRIVMGECHKLQQALDQGNAAQSRKALDSLLLKTVKGAYRWTLLQDALSYCKHMLELRCTARGLDGVDLEKLCDAESYLRIEECAQALWLVLEKLCALTKEQGPYQDLMLRAVYYIKLHYAEDLALTDIAEYANVNPNYLSGTFQKEMGLTVREFITTERVEAAKKLLEEGALRVSDVAEAVGVHDVKYFSRLFKKAAGMTPGEYRERHR